MLSNQQVKTIQIVMVIFIVSTVMSVAYIIYSSQKQKQEKEDAEYYFQMSSTLKKANDNLIKSQKTDTGNIYIIPTDSLAKLNYYNSELPDSVNEKIGRGDLKKLKIIQ